jgi:hypothetical protein
VIGATEGILLGVLQGQFVVSGLGFYIGALCGARFAALAWRVGTKTPLFVLGVLFGVLVEGVGSFLLEAFVVRMAVDPMLLFLCGTSAVLAGVIYFWRYLRRSPVS